MKKALAFIVAMLVSGAASAQVDAHKFYVGAHIGQMKAKGACDDLGGTGISCDDNDTAWKILGGYQFNKNFAAEVGYMDGGEVKAHLGSLRETLSAKTFEAVGVGSLPLADRFSLYGKLGLYHAKVKDRTNFGFSENATSTDLTFGFGGAFDITSQVTARAEWQRYSDVGGSDVGGKSDVDMLSLGVLFKF